ncbi:MAG: porin [Pirellulaceae bacterium]
MKLSKMAFAAAIAWGIYAGPAHAQQPPAGTQGVSYNADYYYFQPEAQASLSDQPHQAPVDKMVQAPSAGYACQDAAACDAGGCEPWRLFCQKDCGWNIYGFANVGAATNDDASFFNGPVTFADRSDAMLNQLYATVENTIDTGGCGWDVGGRVDLLYGSDYIFTQATGLETRDDGSPHWNGGPYYGLAMPQIYGEVGYNDLSVKLGHFYTPIGYEVVPATGNFFYTHSYTMQYGEPFTHTGALATYRWNERTNIIGGFVNGWDHFDRENDTGAVIAGFTWNDGDALSIALTGIASANEPRNPLVLAPTLDTNRDMYSLVIGYQINDCWQYVFQNDMGYQREGSPFTAGTTSAEFYGINQYLFYTMNDCWKFGGRFEWFRDDDGARVGGIRANNPLPVGGFAGNFYETSVGANWTPHANLIVRPEVRYDWYDGETLTGRQPFDTDSLLGDDEQLLAAIDFIFLW